MFLPADTFVGWRYTHAGRRRNFASLISLISMLGIALGIAALITIVSIMNGFERELRERILGMTAHMTVVAKDGPLTAWPEVLNAVTSAPAVIGAAPFIQKEALLTHYGYVQGSAIRGVVPRLEAAVAMVGEHITGGALDALEPGMFNIVLGRGLATVLEARVGDRVAVVVPEPLMTPAGMLPRLRRFRVAGIFEMGIHEYDTALALIHIEDAARLFRFGDGVSGVRVKLEDPFSAQTLRQDMVERIAAARGRGGYGLTDWTETHVNFFRALKTEKITMFLILALVIAVAAFNMVSTLVMVVTDKRADVAILRTLGMSARGVMKVFFIQGAVIGLIGISAGVAAGVVLAANVEPIAAAMEQAFGFKFLSPEVYYVSDIPSELHVGDVISTIGVAAVLCLGAPLYPAWLASRTQPAEALRYE